MAESEELKSLLMRVKEKNEKAGLKLNIQKDNGIWSHHFTANKGEKVEIVADFLGLRKHCGW